MIPRTVRVILLIASIFVFLGQAPIFSQAPIASLGFTLQRAEVLRAQTSTNGYVPEPYMETTDHDTSPDGRSTISEEIENGRPSVWLQHGNTRTLVNGRGTYPQFSPTGEWFALVAPREQNQRWYYPTSLFVYRLEPLRLERRIDIDVRYYAWSPSGDRILITGRLDRERDQPAGIMVAEVISGIERLVDRIQPIRDPKTRDVWQPYVPGFSWSADGRFFVYSRVELTMYDDIIVDADLFVARSDGENRQRLARTPLIAELWPRWGELNQILVHRVHWRAGTGAKPYDGSVQMRRACT